MSARRGPSSMRGRATPRRPGQGGFTMVEILVAVGVLLVALMGIISVFFVGHRDISESGRDTAAAVAAQSLAETLRNQAQGNLPLLDGLDTANPACPANPPQMSALCAGWVTQVGQLPEGRGTVAVAQIRNPGTGKILYRIIITLAWNEAGRGGRQFTLVAGRSD